jgi:hypothetical protein
VDDPEVDDPEVDDPEVEEPEVEEPDFLAWAVEMVAMVGIA